jgi:DNA-directed RNA polymerase subunit RPC12/RpoP
MSDTTIRCPECDTIASEDAFTVSCDGKYTCPDCGSRFYEFEAGDSDEAEFDWEA